MALHGSLSLGLVAALLAASPADARFSPPSGVAPGASTSFLTATSGCPTFDWTASVASDRSSDAGGFELVITRAEVSSEGSADDIVLRIELPAAASGWTPSAERCLPAGRYAWTVRDLADESASPWSAPLFFAVAATPAAGDLGSALALLRRALAADPEARRRLLEALQSFEPNERASSGGSGRTLSPKSILAAGTAVHGEVADATGETYGLRGVSHSPTGAGVRAENLATPGPAGPDLILGHPTEPARVSESGFARTSASNLAFDFANSGAGTMALRVDGADVLVTTDPTVQRRTAASPLTCAAGTYLRAVAADGAPTCAPDATGTPGWSLTGNAIGAGQFLGTTNADALQLRANNTRVLALTSIPLDVGDTANVVAGSSANSVLFGVRGATIAGGGTPDVASDPDFTDEGKNYVSDHYGTVGGGFANRAGDVGGGFLDAAFATVGGGHNNVASGLGSAVGGGFGNQATEENATIAGGSINNASGELSTVGGGTINTASGLTSTVGGGGTNVAEGWHSTVAGGSNNRAGGSGSAVAGGRFNDANGRDSMVSGGTNNCAGGTASWAGGSRAGVRENDTVDTCPWVGSSGDADGDEGTFVWSGDAFGNSSFTSTGPGQFLIQSPGGFGFNTNAPLTDFDVVGNRSGHAMLVQNDATSSPDGLAVRLNVAGNPTTTNNFLTFQRADGSSVGSVEGNGTGGVSFNTAGGDYAEWLPKEDESLDLPPGTVVGLRGGRVSLATRDAEQVAVVSGRPAVAGNDPGSEARDRHALVAFLGQVDVLVDGTIRAGDLLLPSGRDDGFARAVAPEDLEIDALADVLGRAWESIDGVGPHAVRALVGLLPAGTALDRAWRLLTERLDAAERRNADLLTRLERLEAALTQGER